MRKALDWKAKLVVAGILAIFTGFIFYLDWAWDIYGLDYALSVASLFIATAVGLAVIYTLKLTRDSLELTRTATRPFLNITSIEESPPVFPGEKIQLDLYLAQDSAEYVNSGNEIYVKTNIKYIYNGKEEGMTSRVSYLPKSDKGRGRVSFSILGEGSSWK